MKLNRFHTVIQTAMGWTNSHLHQFIAGDVYYGEPDPDYDFKQQNEKNHTVAELAPNVDALFTYEYDFGDCWEHDVLLEKILLPDKNFKHPVCLGGANACPPEDCGGTSGYADFVEAMADPKHPEHESMVEWSGGKGSPWEGGWRVPFAVQWPGHLPPGKVYDQPVLSLDIFATITALAHALTNAARPLDGVNLMPFLTGQIAGAPHDAIYLRMFDKGAFAVRRGDDKLVIPGTGQLAQLFNVTQDISESQNLAGSEPEKLTELEKRRAAWNQQLVEPVFPGLMQTKGGTGKAPAPLD